MMLFKIITSALIISLASWLAGKKTILAGFIVALPLISILSILFVYLEYRDMVKVNQFAVSILVAVPLSLLFFVPFVLNKWLKLNFSISFILGIGLLFVGYLIHSVIFRYWIRG
ncbi:MAG: hypothetical protein NT079_04305 [Candidatus Omnitrophica bacterium]|nr:hypothetical protein [Candidatus Omnitrophota bacterium]